MYDNYMSFFGGHDANFCFYDVSKKKFLTVELEKLIDVKHAVWNYKIPGNHSFNPAYCLDRETIWGMLADMLTRQDIPHSFKHLITGSYYKSFKQSKDTRLVREEIPEPFDFSYWEPHKGHHYAHAIGAIAQMPPEKAVVLTVDGGGDDGVAGMWLLDRTKETIRHLGYVNDRHYSLGGFFRDASYYCSTVAKNTANFLDLAGKTMGLSGYGTASTFAWPKDKFDTIYEALRRRSAFKNELKTFYRHPGDQCVTQVLQEQKDWQEDADYAASIQRESEIRFDEMLQKHFPDFEKHLAEHNGQLILSGGYAMNILNNKRIEKKYNCKVWVPPNPGDNGLAFGMLAKKLHDDGVISLWKDRFDNSFFGPRYRDENLFPEYRQMYDAKPTTINEIADELKQGKILAIMQGSAETGFRALGHRSILCDPSIVTKEEINKVKRREWYRPFAPVCLWKHAADWFDVGYVNNYKHMNIAVDVKPEWQEKLHAITHVDGTARLQAVDEPGFMYDLLTAHRGVLLNTSFNLGGKPICNSILHALYMLEETDIDTLVIEHNDELFRFVKWNSA